MAEDRRAGAEHECKRGGRGISGKPNGHPTFRSRTNKGRPQPYGLYLPRYAETVGNLLIFPINPGGDNDTERFLFALWNALILQRHSASRC